MYARNTFAVSVSRNTPARLQYYNNILIQYRPATSTTKPYFPPTCGFRRCRHRRRRRSHVRLRCGPYIPRVRNIAYRWCTCVDCHLVFITGERHGQRSREKKKEIRKMIARGLARNTRAATTAVVVEIEFPRRVRRVSYSVRA